MRSKCKHCEGCLSLSWNGWIYAMTEHSFRVTELVCGHVSTTRLSHPLGKSIWCWVSSPVTAMCSRTKIMACQQFKTSSKIIYNPYLCSGCKKFCPCDGWNKFLGTRTMKSWMVTFCLQLKILLTKWSLFEMEKLVSLLWYASGQTPTLQVMELFVSWNYVPGKRLVINGIIHFPSFVGLVNSVCNQ